MEREKITMNPIMQYFDAYYKTLQTGNYIDISELFIANRHTVIPIRLFWNRYRLYKTFELEIQDYWINLEIAEVKNYKNRIAAIIIENAEYKYKHVSDDINSIISDIEYYIEMEKIEGKWKISFMDSNKDDYQLVKYKVSQYMEADTYRVINNSTDSEERESVCINRVFDDMDNEIDCLKEILPKVSEKQPKYDNLVKNRYVSSGKNTFSFDSNKGIDYAKKYAIYSQISDEEKLFYYAYNGGDCTNFISQCVWAAYGGYIKDDIRETKKNISKKRKMVYTGNLKNSWYGTQPEGGGTPYWENVEQFFNYVTSPKEVGPRGKVYGSGKQADFDLNNVAPGDIIQFWPDGKGKWYHSVFVTGIHEKSNAFHIFVCQHSMDVKNRPLIELLNWNTNKGQIRGIRFDSAVFSN